MKPSSTAPSALKRNSVPRAPWISIPERLIQHVSYTFLVISFYMEIVVASSPSSNFSAEK